MGATGIPYADMTWSPVVGCTPASAGCKNCWARTLHDMRHAAYQAGKHMPPQYAWPFNKVQLLPDRLDEPLHWRKPRRIFVCSQADLFHRDVPFHFIKEIFTRMGQARQHTYMVFTKRPERAVQWWAWAKSIGYNKFFPLANLWMIVSVEDQESAERRIPELMKLHEMTPTLGVSIEPMLGPVRLRRLEYKHAYLTDALTGDMESWITSDLLGRGPRLSLAILGCESGTDRRPMDLDDARAVRDDCIATGVKFYLKQIEIDGRVVALPELDGRQWLELPG